MPVIKQLLNDIEDGVNIIDCPPGTSCNVVNTLKYADAAILVTEPSEFGLHDLKMAISLVKLYNIPFGVIINKDDGKDNIVKKFCIEENIDLIGNIPYSKNTAVLYSKGEILYYDENHNKIFNNLSKNLREVVNWN